MICSRQTAEKNQLEENDFSYFIFFYYNFMKTANITQIKKTRIFFNKLTNKNSLFNYQPVSSSLSSSFIIIFIYIFLFSRCDNKNFPQNFSILLFNSSPQS